jgi:O-antigen/teichoic acid export membrane protein
MAEFSRFESLAGVFTILSTITVAFALFLIKAFAQGDIQSKKELYRGAEKILMLLGISIYGIYILCAYWINIWLAIDDITMVIFVGAIIPITFASITPASWLQSE